MKSDHLYALVLAGGRGTRFWPRSRRRRSKQVLEFLGEGTLIQQTVARLERLAPRERVWVLTNEHLREEIVRQLPGVPRWQIVAEPAQRNTAPPIGVAAKILRESDPDAVMGIFPADQYIGRPAAFLKTVRAAYGAAAAGHMAILGIQPRWAETGYGYIEFPRGVQAGTPDPFPVKRFREKPALAQAKRYVAAGNFYWNSGMFFWRAGVLLDQLRQHLPKTATLLASLPRFGSRQFAARLARAFPLCDNISIDYAVMEKAGNVRGIAAADFGWNDVGSWNAVYELLPGDGDGNVVAGESVCLDAHRNFVDARGKTVALVGVDDLIVIDTPDALLVARRDLAQQVGDVVKALERRKREDLL